MRAIPTIPTRVAEATAPAHETPDQRALREARRDAEFTYRNLIAMYGQHPDMNRRVHPLAWTIERDWTAGQQSVNSARTLATKAAAWRAVGAKMKAIAALSKPQIAEAVKVQEAEIAAIHAETHKRTAPPTPPAPPPPSAAQVVAAYRRHGCGFVLDGDTLRLTNAADLLPGDLARLREHKPAILALLRAETIEV